MKAPSPNHWTVREFPLPTYFISLYYKAIERIKLNEERYVKVLQKLKSTVQKLMTH